MTISATSWTTTSAEQVHARESRSDIEQTSGSDDFAGMLAGAVQSKAPKPEPRQAKGGTSELDKPEERLEDENDDKKKVKRGRPRAVDAAAANANEVVQSTSALDPELQAKLARVIERMRAETGLEVKVTETYRTQGRQDALFAQGRETDGPVVTWTRDSKHTQGRAVDVALEGGDMDAYAILQRIAKEEGLRTLGPRDPGHLELQSPAPSAATAASDATLKPAEPADATGRGPVSIARLAQVAQVAQVKVEKPAEVARVASVASLEIPGVTSRTQPAQTVTSGESAQIMIDDARSARRSSADSGDSNNDGSSNSKNEHRGGYSVLAAAVAMRDAPSFAPTSIVGASETILSGAERAAQIIAAYQDAPARPLSQITMSVDAGNGITDKVQIALRGSSLNAAIDTGDMRGAEAMRARADELVRALTRDGIEVEALRVRAAAGAAISVPTSQQSSDANQSKFERNQQWQQQHERQRSHDDNRRQQQRDQRGGRDQ